MKKGFWLLLGIFLIQFVGLAQDDTYNKHKRKGQLTGDSVRVNVMVIPTNPELYNSFFDKQMFEKNKMDFYALRDTILMETSFKVSEAITDSTTSAVIPESQTGYKEDMAFVYESINYTYDLLPEPPKEESATEKWKKKLTKPKPEEKKGTYMKDGQIVNEMDNRPRFTNVKIVNPDFLTLLHQKYEAKMFVFINQFEMVISNNITQIDIQSDNYPREIRVHFTVLDEKGKELSSGLVVRNSSSFDDEIAYLINESLKEIGVEIARFVPFSELKSE
jgi:hypothetical protein